MAKLWWPIVEPGRLMLQWCSLPTSKHLECFIAKSMGFCSWHMFMFTLRGSFRQLTWWKEWQQGLRMVTAGDNTHYWESAVGFKFWVWHWATQDPSVFTSFFLLHLQTHSSNAQYIIISYTIILDRITDIRCVLGSCAGEHGGLCPEALCHCKRYSWPWGEGRPSKLHIQLAFFFPKAVRRHWCWLLAILDYLPCWSICEFLTQHDIKPARYLSWNPGEAEWRFPFRSEMLLPRNLLGWQRLRSWRSC